MNIFGLALLGGHGHSHGAGGEHHGHGHGAGHSHHSRVGDANMESTPFPCNSENTTEKDIQGDLKNGLCTHYKMMPPPHFRPAYTNHGRDLKFSMHTSLDHRLRSTMAIYEFPPVGRAMVEKPPFLKI